MNSAIHDWTGAYAAHSLSDTEREEFEAHLRECAPCRAEVASFEEVLAQLSDADFEADAEAGTAPQVPAGLQASVMAEIARTPQEAAPHASATVDGVGSGSVEASTVSSLSDARERHARKPRLGARMLVAAAAVFAVAAVGVGTFLGWGGPTDPMELLAQEVQTAEDAVTVDLGVGQTQVVYSRTAGGFAAVGDAPELEAGHEYQLWIVNADGTINAGPTFEPGLFTAAAAQDLDGVAAIAVSVEPTGGSVQPTTDPIAIVEL